MASYAVPVPFEPPQYLNLWLYIIADTPNTGVCSLGSLGSF